MLLERLKAKRLMGSEPFSLEGKTLDYNIIDFWRWSVSDLVSNATRGRLAEFIVAIALKAPTDSVRDEWSAYDLSTSEGIKVEVKSAAYLQSWAQSAPSRISFSVRRARVWDPETNRQAAKPSRIADVYVFALLAHRDKSTIDPLNLDQWEFYVLGTRSINERTRSQHSISLSSLKRLNAGPIWHKKLQKAVVEAAKKTDRPA
jgi:hypothetical protein